MNMRKVTKYTVEGWHNHISDNLHMRENEIITLLVKYHMGDRTIPLHEIIKYIYLYYNFFKEFYIYYIYY